MNQEIHCSKPRTLVVTWTEKKEVRATKAVIHVTLESKKIIFGDAAMKEASELNSLVAQIKSIEGMVESDISLIGVSTSVEGGVINKSSVSYQITISVKNLEVLSSVFNVLLADKDAKVKNISWHYPVVPERETLMETAIARAKEKAERIARFLGIKISGVYSFEEEPSRYFGSTRLEKSIGVRPPNYLDFEVSAITEISLTVKVEYLID
ncbi:MAG: SIMPL domain-containing protein [bacterium]|nr:SIMPL domain-containing protein [bacterium]